MSDDKVTAKKRKTSLRKPLAEGQTRSGVGGKPSIDWTSMEAEFISSPGQPLYEDLARKYGSTRRSVACKSRENDWPAKREELQRGIIEQAKGDVIINRAAKLVLWNQESLLEAGWLREAARKLYMRHVEGKWLFNGDINPKAISAAAAAHMTADKLARLALGVSTENLTAAHSSLPASVDDFV